MSMSEAIKEAYASEPVDQVEYETLEFHHPAFVDDFGQPTAIRVVCAYEEHQFGLESTAPMNAGEMVTFHPVPFTFTEPGYDEDQVPQLQFSVSNVSREITRHLEQAIARRDPIKLYYRNYISTDPSGPQIDPVIVMELTSASATVMSITGTATLSDVHNWPFPLQKYTTERFKGLAR